MRLLTLSKRFSTNSLHISLLQSTIYDCYRILLLSTYFSTYIPNGCKNAHKPRRFLSPRERALFVCLFTGISFSSLSQTVCYKILKKTDGGEENSFIGCAYFSQKESIYIASEHTPSEWQWQFFPFVCKIFAR